MAGRKPLHYTYPALLISDSNQHVSRLTASLNSHALEFAFQQPEKVAAKTVHALTSCTQRLVPR